MPDAEALQAFPHLELRKGARSFVFAEGRPEARVMVVGDSPDREDDRAGRPFAGARCTLLDRMLGEIGLDRKDSAYLTLLSPWRPVPEDRLDPADSRLLAPFLRRHIALAQPDVVILLVAAPCEALLGSGGVSRLRGSWVDVLGRPALPMQPPDYLMRVPAAKRDAWADLLSVRARLEDGS